jgi:hypothetical protein
MLRAALLQQLTVIGEASRSVSNQMRRTVSGRAVATDRRFSKRRGAPIFRHRVVAGLAFGAGSGADFTTSDPQGDRGRVSRHWFAVRRTLTVGERRQPLGVPDTPGGQGRVSCQSAVWRYQVQRSVVWSATPSRHTPVGREPSCAARPAAHRADHQSERAVRRHLQPEDLPRSTNSLSQ